MKPSKLLLSWVAVLLAIAIVLGTLQALQIELPASLLSINWGLLLALLALATLDAVRLKRLPTVQIKRQMPGSLALGRWGEVQLKVEHDFAEPLNIQIFDHVPDGLSFEKLPLNVALQPGQHSLRCGDGAASAVLRRNKLIAFASLVLMQLRKAVNPPLWGRHLWLPCTSLSRSVPTAQCG